MSTPILDAMTMLTNTMPGADAPVVEAPAAPAAPAPELDSAAKEPVKTAYLNPYAKRAAKAAPAPVAAPVAAPAAPTAEDPRIASLSAQVADLMSVVSRQATTELSVQPEPVKQYLAKIAGDSPAKQLEALHNLKASGLLNTPPSLPTGATTAPAGAPKPGVGPASPDAAIRAEYESLKGSPILQAEYRRQHGAALARFSSNN